MNKTETTQYQEYIKVADEQVLFRVTQRKDCEMGSLEISGTLADGLAYSIHATSYYHYGKWLTDINPADVLVQIEDSAREVADIQPHDPYAGMMTVLKHTMNVLEQQYESRFGDQPL